MIAAIEEKEVIVRKEAANAVARIEADKADQEAAVVADQEVAARADQEAAADRAVPQDVADPADLVAVAEEDNSIEDKE